MEILRFAQDDPVCESNSFSHNLRHTLDMNLSVEWVAELARHGYDAVHWSTVGDLRAADTVIMSWARDNGRMVFTHDLDFGTILALTHANGPSVLQVRGQDTFPHRMSPFVIAALRRYESALAAGAIVVVEERRSRVRVFAAVTRAPVYSPQRPSRPCASRLSGAFSPRS